MRILQCRYASVCGCCPIFFENKANWNLFLEKFVRACKKLRSYPSSSKIKEKKKNVFGYGGQCCGAGAGRSRYFFGRSRCKDVKAKTCFLLLFSLFLYEEEPEPEPVKKKYLEPESEPVKSGPAPQH